MSLLLISRMMRFNSKHILLVLTISFLTPGNFKLDAAPPIIMGGVAWYNDPIEDVVGNDFASLLGNLDGVALHGFFRGNFYHDYFYYRFGFNTEIAFPKKVKDGDLTYKLNQTRAEIPVTIGASLWTPISRFYMGAGFSFNFYELVVDLEQGAKQRFLARGLARTQHIGLMFNLTKKLRFYIEMNWLQASIKGRHKIEEFGETNLILSPNYHRLYFGVGWQL